MNAKFNYGYIPDSYIYQPKYNELVKYNIDSVSSGTPWNSIFKSSLLRIIPNKTMHNKFTPINSYLYKENHYMTKNSNYHNFKYRLICLLYKFY